MNIEVLYGKLHNARVTDCELFYNGSMGIDRDLMDAAGLVVGQKVDVVNINNAERFTTYLLEEARGSKKFAIYGAAARKAYIGDNVIIIAYASVNLEEAKQFEPKVIILDGKDNIIKG